MSERKKAIWILVASAVLGIVVFALAANGYLGQPTVESETTCDIINPE
jgi:hypothetical protein